MLDTRSFHSFAYQNKKGGANQSLDKKIFQMTSWNNCIVLKGKLT